MPASGSVPEGVLNRRDIWIWLLLLIPLGFSIKVFFAADIPASHVWNPEGWVRFEKFSAFMIVLSALFGTVARRWFFPAMAAAIVILSAVAVKPVPVLTVLLFIFCLTVLGRVVFGAALECPLALLGGMAIWVAAMYAVADLPIHYPAVYLAALILPLLPGRHIAYRLATEWGNAFRPSEKMSAGGFCALAAGLFALTANWLIVLKPEVSADGLAMHLAIPAGMAQHHRFAFDFHEFIWALMPMGGDYCYSVVYSLGGEYAARLLNFALLVTIALMVFRAVCRFVSTGVACFLTALLISSPMIFLISGSLFVENYVAAMVLGSVIAVSNLRERPSPRNLLLAATLLGTAMAMKSGAIPVAVIGLCVILPAIRRIASSRRFALGAAAVVLVLGLGSIPYAKAWILSGNPVFPFQNNVFHSPVVGDDIVDERYQQKLNWRTPLNLTFRTSRYYEGQNGSLGFQFILFLPLVIGVLIAKRWQGDRSDDAFLALNAVAIGTLSALTVALAQPNARYLYFTFPLLTIGMAALFAWLRPLDRRIRIAAFSVAIVAMTGNLALMPTADWYHREFYSSPLFRASGRANYLRRKAPVREVVDWLNRRPDATAVMFADGATMAGLQATAFENHWHDYHLLIQLRESARPADVLAVLRKRGIVHVVADREHTGRQESLSAVLTRCGTEEYSAESYVALRLNPDCESILAKAPPPFGTCAPGKPLAKGTYDDRDTAFRFLGPWTHEQKFSETFARTISYSNAPEARACVSFEGTGFEYVFTKALNRGKAEILIDGKSNSVENLYSEVTKWQSRVRITGLPPGRHELTLRVLPEKEPASTDFYVDLDAFTVF